MSNELTTSVNVLCSNGGFKEQFQVSANFNQGAVGESAGIMLLTTSDAAIPVGALATVGWLCLKNLDTTNNVLVGNYVSSTYQAFGKLLPGEWSVMRIDPSATLHAKSSASTVAMQYIWLNA